MKRFFSLILAISLFLPSCGNVWATQSGETESVGHSHHATVASAETATPHPHLAKSAGLNCCESDRETLDSGIPNTRTDESFGNSAVIAFVAPATALNEKEPGCETVQGPPPTAPPSARHEYSNLVGIVKNLN